MAELNSLKVDGITELNSLTINGIGILDLITNSIYPIGSIYISVNDINPSTLFGGTWEAWGSGRVPIGVNSQDTDFDAVEKTGGNKVISLSHTHTLSHTHGIPGVAHTHTTAGHTLTTSEIPSHTHNIRRSDGAMVSSWVSNVGSGSGWYGAFDGTSSGNPYVATATGGGGSHSHGNTGSTTPSSTITNSQSTTTTSSSGSSSQSIMNPYITCYMWKRIA